MLVLSDIDLPPGDRVDDDGEASEPQLLLPPPHGSVRHSVRSDTSTCGQDTLGQGSMFSSRYSDFTLPVSNRFRAASPPLCVVGSSEDRSPSSAASDPPVAPSRTPRRRPVFPPTVQRKYDIDPATRIQDGLLWAHQAAPEDRAAAAGESYPGTHGLRQQLDARRGDGLSPHTAVGQNGHSTDPYGVGAHLDPGHAASNLILDHVSPLPSPSFSVMESTAPPSPIFLPASAVDIKDDHDDYGDTHRRGKRSRQNSPMQASARAPHGQSLLVALAIAAVWSPSNLLAPNLTRMAKDLGIHGTAARDLYLGSYCALASSVLSAPMGAGIGLLADLTIARRWRNRGGSDSLETATTHTTLRVTRHALFCWTIAGGAATAWLTGTPWCTRYRRLLLLRIVNGGFMAGSVPIAFSIMADTFGSEHRNAASSGLTAMMGLGMILGQVYAGMTGAELGWQHSFRVSGVITMVLAVLCLLLVQEPERGGMEKALQDMIQSGKRYDRKLTWSGFWRSMRQNKSNAILIWQGFFSSVPWGIISVFLNDYLSQERGFSVADATFMVLCFGIGCAFGGILGGIWGQIIYDWNRSFLPLYMAASTMLGIIPFLVLLNTHFTNAHGPLGIFVTVSGGFIANLPSVNARPCLINVNPPESRGAALTASNVLVNLGRGLGPSAVTLMMAIGKVDRQFAFNVTLIVFWTISALQLVLLARTLPQDQDAMESELESYALLAMGDLQQPPDDSVEVSIQERMNAFDEQAARETLYYVRQGLSELREELGEHPLLRSCGLGRAPPATIGDSGDDDHSGTALPTETTPLMVKCA